jgi:hypothetical protein
MFGKIHMERQRRFVLHVAFVALLVFTGCGDSNLDAEIATARLGVSIGLVRGVDAIAVREAAAIRRRNVVMEAEAAAHHRDFRLIGVAGVGLFFPGVPGGERLAQRVQRLGVREIMGSGDAVNQYTVLHQSAACQFALTYNQLILKKLNRQQR